MLQPSTIGCVSVLWPFSSQIIPYPCQAYTFCRAASQDCLTLFCAVLLSPVGDTSETQAEMVVRLQTKDVMSWIWIYSLLRVENAEVPITCHNYIIR